MQIIKLEDYNAELATLNTLVTNSVFIKRGNSYFHLCDYMLNSSSEPLTEKWKQRIARGEKWFPLEEASLFIKPPGSKLYQAKQGLVKTAFVPGQNTVNIPKLNANELTVWQPYMSWHGGQSTNAMRGQNYEAGTISIKGYKPQEIGKGFKEAKEAQGEYSHRIAPSVSKDRLAGGMHMVASVIANNTSLSLVSANKPGNAIELGEFELSQRPVINEPGVTSIIDMTNFSGASFVVMFFVHHGAFNSEYGIKPELDSRVISEPFTVQSQYKGSVNCTIVAYALDNEVILQEVPLIFWANSIDQAQQMFIELIGVI